MAHKHWRKPDYWRWFWRKRLPPEVRAVVATVLIALTLGGGWLAADRLSRATAGTIPGGVLTVETTVQKLVTVRERPRVVRKLVPVLRKVLVEHRPVSKTTTEVRTVTANAAVRTVHDPIVLRKTITVSGTTKTAVTTRLVPTTTIETQTKTVTQSRTQTQIEVQTSTLIETQTITEPVTTTQTVTVNQKKPVATVTVTVTVTT